MKLEQYYVRVLILLGVFYMPVLVEAQIHCLVRDSLNVAIPYVNAYIPAAGKGTLSDENGYFEVSTENLSDTNTVVISCLNYQPVQFSVKQLLSSSDDSTLVIRMSEVSYDTPTIEVRGVVMEFENKWLGVPDPKGANRMGYNVSGRGSERAVLIENNDRCRLDEINIFVSNVKVDSFDVEVSIYAYDAGEVKNKLQRERIFVSIKKDQANNSYSIDLKDNVMFIDGSFLVSTTMLNDLHDVVAMLESSPKKKYTGFRHKLDGTWIRTSDCPTISVLLSCPK